MLISIIDFAMEEQASNSEATRCTYEILPTAYYCTK